MAPKLKTSKSEWQQCNACKVVVSTRDVDEHENSCLGKAWDEKRDAGLLSHDYVAATTLHGTIRELPSKCRFKLCILLKRR